MNTLYSPAPFTHISAASKRWCVSWQAAEEAGRPSLVVTNRWPKDLPAQEEWEGLTLRRYVFRVPERTWKQMGGFLLFGEETLRMCALR